MKSLAFVSVCEECVCGCVCVGGGLADSFRQFLRLRNSQLWQRLEERWAACRCGSSVDQRLCEVVALVLISTCIRL